jgi:hypothetical protein
MKTPLIIALGLALASSAAAQAQTTPPPSTDHSGGPTATAGSSAQSNTAPPSGRAMTAKKPMHHKMAPKAKTAGSAAATALPDGKGGASTPSGH